MVDQSVYNYLLPVLESKNKIRLGKENFMIWAKSQNACEISLKQISEASLQSGLVHWAGCDRIPNVSKMLQGHILVYFEKYYYSCLRSGKMIYQFRKIIPQLKFFLKYYYRKARSICKTMVIKDYCYY
jgi:hypothetical protein